jgi:hypothetical protein
VGKCTRRARVALLPRPDEEDVDRRTRRVSRSSRPPSPRRPLAMRAPPSAARPVLAPQTEPRHGRAARPRGDGEVLGPCLGRAWAVRGSRPVTGRARFGFAVRPASSRGGGGRVGRWTRGRASGAGGTGGGERREARGVAERFENPVRRRAGDEAGSKGGAGPAAARTPIHRSRPDGKMALTTERRGRSARLLSICVAG